MGWTPLFAYTDADGWHLGIGDPTAVGWLTVAAYFFAAFLSWKAAGRARAPGGWPPQAVFWVGLAALLVMLGINKQLDLQTWFTLAAKRAAQSQGWYENRRIVQFLFILALGAGSLFAVYLAWRT